MFSEYVEPTHVIDRHFVSQSNHLNFSRDALIHHQIKTINAHIRSGGWWPANPLEENTEYHSTDLHAQYNQMCDV